MTAEQHLTNSKAQRRTEVAAVSTEHVMATASLASRRLPVPSECLLEHMLEVELEEAKTTEDNIYHSGIAARMYGESREATVAARVVEMFTKQLEAELHNILPQEHGKSGRPHDLVETCSAAAIQKVRAQVAASVEAEHRRLDRHVTHALHAAALMLLAQLNADSPAAGTGEAEEQASESWKPPTDSMPQTSGVASKDQAFSKLPTAAPTAVVSKRSDAVPERAASSHHPESTAASGVLPDMYPKRTQQSAQKVSVSIAASKDGTDNLLQPMACDRSLQHLPLPEGTEQAPRQHSSASQNAPRGAASNAERSSSSSTAGGAAFQGAAVPEGTRLSSNKQAAGSHGSPGRVLPPPCLRMCLFSSI